MRLFALATAAAVASAATAVPHPALDVSAVAPTVADKTTAEVKAPAAMAVAASDGKMHVISLQTSPAPTPPPNTTHACTSHNVYVSLMEAMTMTQNLTIDSERPQNGAGTDEGAQIATLVAVGIVSLLLLIFGSSFATASLAATVFLVGFLFIFGIADNLSFDASEPSSFSMCVLPFVLALMAGALLAILCLCLVQKFASMSFFLMGVCFGGVGMYVLREIIVSASPSLANSPDFRWYWLGCAVAALLCGFLAAALKEVVFAVATVAVGAYGMATFVCGIIPVVGGEAVGGAAFVAVMVGAASFGGLCQYCLMKNKEAKTKEAISGTGKDPLMAR